MKQTAVRPAAALQHMALAILAVGTRGDVQPLLALAVELRRRLPGSRVTLITHEAHRSWVEAPAATAGVQLRAITTQPARVWLAAHPAAAEAAPGDAAAREEQHREELIVASEQALELSCARAASEPAARRLLVFNLFALEGFSISEALGVPCVAASPCLIPYTMPTGFEREFQLAHARLYRRLQASDEQRKVAEARGAAAPGPAGVAWCEVRHWLWPLFGRRCGAWRLLRLGLPPLPFTCPPDVPLPPPPPLLYGAASAAATRALRIMPGACSACQHATPQTAPRCQRPSLRVFAANAPRAQV